MSDAIEIKSLIDDMWLQSVPCSCTLACTERVTITLAPSLRDHRERHKIINAAYMVAGFVLIDGRWWSQWCAAKRSDYQTHLDARDEVLRLSPILARGAA